MAVYLAQLMLVPLFIGIIGLFFTKGRITWKEFLVMEGACVLIIVFGYGIAQWSATDDTEVWSGHITSKAQETVSCEHSYSCNCHSVTHGFGKDETTTIECDTCYEHSHDYDWALYTTDNGRITIDRVDRQGTRMPGRYATAYVTESTASTHSFENYIKANPGSILRRTDATARFKALIPSYPDNVYDYYRVDRFVQVGMADPHAKEWNWLLTKLNDAMGARKKLNVVVVAARVKDPTYEYAIEESWLGGKKNDLVVILGVPNYPKIDWVRIVSWTDAQSVKVYLRDAIQDIGTMDRRDDIVAAIWTNADKYFVHKHMDDFKYLLATSQPGTGVTIFLMIFGTAVCFGLAYYFYMEDPFDSPYRY